MEEDEDDDDDEDEGEGAWDNGDIGKLFNSAFDSVCHGDELLKEVLKEKK